jgi:hypothetical protein
VPRAVLEDDYHGERLREFDSVDKAVAELRRLEVMNSDELASEIGPTPCVGNCGSRELLILAEGKVVARSKLITRKP